MTKFIRSNNLKVGDELYLTTDDEGIKHISFKKHKQQHTGKFEIDPRMESNSNLNPIDMRP